MAHQIMFAGSWLKNGKPVNDSEASGYNTADYYRETGIEPGRIYETEAEAQADADRIMAAVDCDGIAPCMEIVDVDVDEVIVARRRIQIDRSGQGHAWRDATSDEVPGNIREEIAAEIIDGKRESGEYVATNGQHYRW